MPIDFNSHIMLTIPRPYVSAAVRQNANTQLQSDVFIKNINKNIDKDYDGIKIEKKSFGLIKKQMNKLFFIH